MKNMIKYQVEILKKLDDQFNEDKRRLEEEFKTIKELDDKILKDCE